MSDQQTTAATLAALDDLCRIFGPPPPRPPRTYDEERYEAQQEARAEDAAHERRWGHVDRGEEQVRQRRYEAWLDRIGGAA